MNSWEIIDSGVGEANDHMAQDLQLLRGLNANSKPILHFYEWNAPTITYGYFLDIHKRLNLPNAQSKGIALARRPTGGGVTLHFTDFAFSLLIPASHPAYSINTLENYRYVHQLLLPVARHLSGQDPYLFEKTHTTQAQFCMADPMPYDIMVEGKKLVGGAQRRMRNGFLHQGSILLSQPSKEIIAGLITAEIQDRMIQNSFLLLPSAKDSQLVKLEIKQLLVFFFSTYKLP